MQHRYIIEIAGKPAGVVIAEHHNFRFFAARDSYTSLDQKVFRSPGEAEDACRRFDRLNNILPPPAWVGPDDVASMIGG